MSSYAAAECTEEEIAECMAWLSEIKRRKLETALVPAKPEPFKSEAEHGRKWRSFSEKTENYFSQVYGTARIPLSYLLRTHDTVEPNHYTDPYDTFEQYLMRCTVFEDSHYRRDNALLWVYMKEQMVDGPGWPFISKFEGKSDGRGAWLALTTQYASTSSLDSRKRAAYSRLEHLQFTGPKKGWSIDQYIGAMQKQFAELDDCKEPVPETKKVQDFLDSITDPRFESAKTNVCGDDAKLNDFEACQLYFSKVGGNVRLLGRRRTIGAIGIDDENDGQPKTSFDHLDYKKKYSRNDWFQKLSKEEKAWITEARKNDPSYKGFQDDDGKDRKQRGKGRNVSTIERLEALVERQIAAMGNTTTTDDPDDEDTSRAGPSTPTSAAAPAADQFGRHAHNKRKRD